MPSSPRLKERKVVSRPRRWVVMETSLSSRAKWSRQRLAWMRGGQSALRSRMNWVSAGVLQRGPCRPQEQDCQHDQGNG
jgi:hypothetical protein